MITARTSTMALADIRVGTRIRQAIPKLDDLASSIADIGLLNPITVHPDGRLIAGELRMMACKQLGWTEIPVRIVDLDDIVRGEIAENVHRTPFLPSEIDAIRITLEQTEKAHAKERMSEGGKGSESFATLPGKVTDKIGAYVGVSGRTVEKIAAVMDAARAEPEKYGKLAADMDRTGNVIQTVHRKFLDAWTGRLPVRFLIMSNELPRLADASGALASRFILLVMEHSFYGCEDPGLGGRLMPELPGVLNWALAGYRRLRGRGHFVQPVSARDALADLEALGSPVKAFVRDCCVIEPGRQCTPDVIYDAWKAWCAPQGRKEPGTLQNFGRDLRAVVPGVKMVQPRADGRRVRLYEGIGVDGY
jgi:ParB-like chromosome segregation protein Spo0J